MRLQVEVPDRLHAQIKEAVRQVGYESMAKLFRDLLEDWLLEQGAFSEDALGTYIVVGVDEDLHFLVRRKVKRERRAASSILVKCLRKWVAEGEDGGGS